MEVSISRKDFLDGLKDIQTIVERRTTLPVLNNFLISTKQETIEIKATDLELEYKGLFPARVIRSGTLLLPSRKTYEIVREIGEEDIDLSIEENWVKIEAGSSVFRMPRLPSEEYPSFGPQECFLTFTLPAGTLRELITKTIFATSQESTRSVLNGVLLSLSVDDISMVATDGYRLAFVTKKAVLPGMRDELEVVVPRKVLMETKKIFLDPEQEVNIGLYKRGIVFRYKNITLSSLLLEGEFPNYRQVIPEDNEKKVVVKKEPFLQILRRVSILSDEQSNLVNLHLRSGRLEVSSRTPHLGEARDEMEIEYTKGDLDICFNAKYLLEGAGIIDDEYLLLELEDSSTAAIVRPLSSEGCLNVIMPIKVD